MAQEEEVQSPGLPIRAIRAAILRHWRLILAIVMASLCTSIVYTAFQVPVFRAQASVLLEDRPKVIVGTAQAGEWMDLEMAKAQQQLAKSQPVLERAAEFAGPEAGSADPRSALSPLGGGGAELSGTILYLGVTHTDPKRAADLANHWVKAFVDETTRRERSYPRYTTSFLTEETERFRKKWYAKLEELKAFRMESIYDPKESDRHPVRTRYVTLSERLDHARIRMAELDAETKSWAEAKDNIDLLSGTSRARQDHTFQDHYKQIQHQRGRLIALRQVYLPESEECRNAEQSLKDYEELARKNLSAIGAQIRADLNGARNEVVELERLFHKAEAEFEALKSKDHRYQILLSEATRAQEEYEMYANRLQQADVESRVGISYVRPLEHAVVPGAPFRPSWPRNLMMGLMLGILLAGGAVYLSEALDDSIRTPDQLRDKLGLNVMGAIPLGESASDRGLYFVSRDFPRNAVVESLRTLRNSLAVGYLRGALSGAQGAVVLVTSPNESDGKSFLASNLAQLFAGRENRVLLVDMDLHKGSMTKAMEAQGKPGLTSLIEGEKGLDELVVHTQTEGLDFLPRGERTSNAVRAIESATFSRLLKEARERYQIILLDSPPVLAVADSTVVAAQSDVVLVAVRSRKTTKGQVQRAAEILGSAQARERLYILNGLDASDADAYGYEYQYAYKEGYGSSHTSAIQKSKVHVA